MWKKLSTPYKPVVDDLGNYGAYGYASYAPLAVGHKTKSDGTSSIAFGYSSNYSPVLRKNMGIIIGDTTA